MTTVGYASARLVGGEPGQHTRTSSTTTDAQEMDVASQPYAKGRTVPDHPDGGPVARRMEPARWHADTFQDAIWECRTLSLKAKALAVTFARHARDEAGERSASASLAWLTYERAMEQTSIGKRTAIASATRELVDGGWLVPVRVIARRPTVYRLAVPAVAGSSHGGTTAQGTTETPVVPTGRPPVLVGSSLPAAGSSLSESGSSPVGTSVVPTGERDFSLKSTSQT